MTSKTHGSVHDLTFCAIALLLLMCLPTAGQVVGGSLTGTVSDSTGAVIPKAKVSIRNSATGVTREVITDASGFYTAPNLSPGTYNVTASAAGFATQSRSGVVLTVGAQQVLNLSMQVGGVNEKVSVTSEAPLVQLSSSSLIGEVQEKTVRDLPLNGRDWTQLATLQPGVVSLGALQPNTVNASSARGNRGFGTQLTISGGRPQQNNYRVDGISVNDYDNSSPGNALGVAMGVDAIQEFSVVTSNYSAEYGRTSGGVVNAVTRSGTNQLHGSVYEFLRNSALDARNYFDGPTIPAFRRNQFGASLGGPIRKDKTFFFADYEGLRQSLGITGTPTVPSDDVHNGIIHNANGTTTNIAIDPKIAPLLALYPRPNAGLVGIGNTGKYRFVAQQNAHENYVTSRVDHHFSDKDSFFATYQFDDSLATVPDGLDLVLIEQKSSPQHIAAEETHLFSSQLVNAFRVGYNRDNAQAGGGISAINPAINNPALQAIPGQGLPATSTAGIQNVSGSVIGQPMTRFHWNAFQVYDDAFLTRGKHSLKFGFDVERDQNNLFQNFQRSGNFAFGSLTALLQNRPTSFVATLPSTIAPRYLRQTIYGAYLQDDIRWKPYLTLNLGLRYETSSLPTENSNKLVNLRNLTDATAHIGDPLFNNPTRRDFQPRVGFAWDPFHDGKSSVRGGFGLFDVLPLIYEYSLTELNLAPFAETGRVNPLPQGAWPAGGIGLLAPKTLRVAYIAPQKRNYVLQWNMSVQREISTGFTGTLAYLGSRGIHQLFRGDDTNMVLPTVTSAGYLWPASGGQVLNPNFGRIDISTWNNNSYYHALEAQLNKQLSHGLYVGASYTFAKSIDQGSGSNLGDPYANSISNLFFFENSFNRALSDFDVRHTFVADYTWTLPTPALDAKAAKWALGGWQLGGVFNYRTGMPFSVLIGGDPLNTQSSSPFDYPSRVSGCGSPVNPGNPKAYINLNCFSLPMATPAIAAQCVPFSKATVPGTCANLQGNAARNSLIGPGLVDFDFSLLKNNYIGGSERFNVQFRAEFFNVINHANFSAPNDQNTLYDQNGAAVGGAGLIDSTSTTSRQIQFALKLIW